MARAISSPPPLNSPGRANRWALSWDQTLPPLRPGHASGAGQTTEGLLQDPGSRNALAVIERAEHARSRGGQVLEGWPVFALFLSCLSWDRSRSHSAVDLSSSYTLLHGTCCL